MKNNRRQFLRNISLGSLGLGFLPFISSAKEAGSSKVTACVRTTQDYYGQGPFYTANPPQIVNSQLAFANEAGQRMIISGRVFNLDCTEVINGARIDIWHADDAGDYDNSGYKLRGFTYSNAQGFYLFETIKPGKYLNGPQYRPSHIHFKITPPNFPTLTTQLYFDGDTSIPNDAAASITSGTYDASGRIVSLSPNGNGKLEGTWDIVLDGTGVTGRSDLHLNKGMVYSAAPSPFFDQLTIKYGVFQPANVSVLVFDMQGRTVADIEEREIVPGKYSVVWQPDSSLPPGPYFIALKMNDLQVHYQKVLRLHK